MSSMRALLGSVLSFGLCAATGCSAGTDDISGGNGGGSGASDSGGSMMNGFEVGGAGGGTTSGGCSSPDCVGSTPQGNCDSGLQLTGSANDAAKAIGICKDFTEGTWGVKEATWVKSDGSPLGGGDLDLGHGILSHFGSHQPREGSTLLALSSGSARNPEDAGYQDVGGFWKDDIQHGAPPGYPKTSSPSCSSISGTEFVDPVPYDSAALRVVLKTPIDAKSLSFEFNFYTYEYPDYICSVYNDFFVTMMTPTPAGLADGNICFDGQGNNIGVNAGFLDACTATTNNAGKNFPCTQGYSSIPGTGFEGNTFNCGDSFDTSCTAPSSIPGSAATGWLQTKAPITTPGEDITLQFTIWDSGDGVLDSTTIIDNFRFELDETTTGTQPVPQ